MAISLERLSEIAQKGEIDTTDIAELDNDFFKDAIQVNPGDSMLSEVRKKIANKKRIPE